MKEKPTSKLSKTSLKVRIRKKTAPKLSEMLRLALKSQYWTKYLKMLSAPTRMHSAVNLSQIDEKTSAGDTILVPGKVLSMGEINKKIRICSFSISKLALEKLKKTKSEWAHISDEIKKNPKAEALKIIK